jgi:hypothetical protein
MPVALAIKLIPSILAPAVLTIFLIICKTCLHTHVLQIIKEVYERRRREKC